MDLSTNQIELKDSILKKSTLLYVEDEDVLREEISTVFESFFAEVILASNGEEALEIFKNRQKDIDILITDINMPKMNGMELIANIRKIDNELPILVCTAFNDSEILIRAIKLNVNDYIIKPIQMITTLKICNKILTNKNNELLIKKQVKELKDLKSILENENFIIETSLDGKIEHVNDLMCNISGYTKEELIGETNNILKHPDTSKEFISNLWNTISSGKTWHGKIKNLSKDGSTFYVKTTILPIFDENQNIIKYLSTGFLITAEEEEKQNLKRLILQQKGEKLKYEHEIEKRVEEELKKSINASLDAKNNQNQKLIALVNEMDEEIKRLRHKNLDNNSRVLTSEKYAKETQDRFDNMQIAYQEKITGLNNTVHILAKKCEDLIKKSKISAEKIEKAQKSITVLQSYIDEYRKKISDLEDVIASYEKDLQTKKY